MAQFDELHLITFASALLVGIVFVLPDSPIRIVLGLPFVLFFPGYALIATLYPRREELEGVERLALSVGLSLAVVPLIGLMLSLLPWGIRLGPIVITLTSFIAICSVLAERRRMRLPRGERFCIAVVPLLLQARRISWPVIATVTILTASAAFAAWRLHGAAPRAGESFTEFYVLGPSGEADSYPREVVAGQSASVILGVTNHELRQVTYRIVVQENSQVLATLSPVTLRDGQKWEQPVRFTAVKPGERERIEFLLFTDSSPAPCHRLYLWVRIPASSDPRCCTSLFREELGTVSVKPIDTTPP